MKPGIPSFMLLLLGLAAPCMVQAQTVTHITDPFDDLFARAAAHNPNFRQDMEAHNRQLEQRAAKYITGGVAKPQMKTTANNTVAVVFHVVLDTAQMNQLGGQQEIIKRINSQMAVLNEDYNAVNADTGKIPNDFKPLKANMDIRFALAHTDPNGHYTPGYEFVTTTKTGFDLQNGSQGSTFYCSDAKYAAGGGADAWDVTKYINVWVLNITPLGVGGVGTPPPYPLYGGTAAFPWAEQGIVLSYGVLGRRDTATQFFFSGTAIKGRSFVHEMGHFFNLFHTFGMSTFNNSNCTDDDGVGDTPLQVGPTQTTPVFPVLDNCSQSSPGIMYVNHMDYTADSFRTMFTIGQKARAYVEVDTLGYRHSLFLHPEVLNNGTTGIAGPDASMPVFRLYPNPASNNVTISFSSHKLLGVAVLNTMGQEVAAYEGLKETGEYKLDVSGYSKGYYFVRCRFDDGVRMQKLFVQ